MKNSARHFNPLDTNAYCARILKHTLPNNGAYVGLEKSRFIIPLVGEPKQFLQAGDILLFLEAYCPRKPGFFNLYARAMVHACIIVECNGQLHQVHAPSALNRPHVEEFPYKTFHVIRLAKQLPNKPVLSKWSADFSKAPPNTQKSYQQWRSSKLETVNTLGTKIFRSSYHYNNSRRTPLTMSEADRDRFLDQLGSNQNDYYCSELAYAPYAGAGFPFSSGPTFRQLAQRISHDFKIQSVHDDIDGALNSVLNDRTLLVIAGATDQEINEIQSTLGKPNSEVLKRNRFALERLIKMQFVGDAAKTQLTNELTAQPRPDGTVIGVPSIFDMAESEGGPFEYVGTYCSSILESGKALMTGNSWDTERYEWESTIAATSLVQHTFNIVNAEISPNQEVIVTTSIDEIARFYNHETCQTLTVHLGGQPQNVRFVPSASGFHCEVSILGRAPQIVDLAPLYSGHTHRSERKCPDSELIGSSILKIGSVPVRHLEPITRVFRVTKFGKVISVSGNGITVFS